jgi:hypothetical protein
MTMAVRTSPIRRILLFGFVLLLTSLACSSAATTEPDDAEEPEATTAPTATVKTASDPEEWPVVFSDTFDEDTGDWFTGPDEGDYAIVDISIADGKYLFSMTTKEPSTYWLTPDAGRYGDVLVSVDVERVSGTQEGDYGLMFRLDEEYYHFSINSDWQEYSVYLSVGDDWEAIIDYTESDLINPDGSNRLAVLAVGSTFTLYLNGQELDSFTDDRLPRGEVGIAVNMYNSGETLDLEFDNFEIKAPR